jgi:hypothetical protein
MDEIAKIEEKYGVFIFKLALAYLMDVGIRNLNDEDAMEENIKNILAQNPFDKSNGFAPVLALAFQADALSCAGELAAFNSFSIFAYVKENVFLLK